MPDPVDSWQATATGTDDPEVAAALLWQAGAVAVQVAGPRVIGHFPIHVPDLDLAMAGAATTLAWDHLPAVDHMAPWRASSRPVRAGPFDLVPTHLAATHTTPAPVHRIVVDAGMAFGSGHHDTTAGCLEALGGLAVDGAEVLDVGTGTGVLAIGAALRGAARVVGVDTDAHAIEVARRNAAANGVEVDVLVGSTEVVAGTFDVVLANLLTGLVVALADELARLVRPGGWLVASGVGRPRTRIVVTALAAAGFVDLQVTHRGEWVVLTGQRAETAPLDGHGTDGLGSGSHAPGGHGTGDHGTAVDTTTGNAASSAPTRWPPDPADVQ